jgi:cobalt-zinc-cadmium resistance protein CzcA
VGQALLIMLNVPLALIGGVVALSVTGLYLSVPGSIGFIAVFGDFCQVSLGPPNRNEQQ